MSQAFSINVHSGIVAHYLLAYRQRGAEARWLPKMARGEIVAAIAMSEPGAGTDLQASARGAARRRPLRRRRREDLHHQRPPRRPGLRAS